MNKVFGWVLALLAIGCLSACTVLERSRVSEAHDAGEISGIDVGGNGLEDYDGPMNYYEKTADKVYFVKARFVDVRYYQEKTLVEGADYDSFTVLGEAGERNSHSFAKDDRYAYHQGKAIDGADAASFVWLRNGFAKDKNAVYYHDQVIEGADAQTFTALSGIYGVDKSHVYYLSVAMEEVDMDSFRACDEYAYATDKHRVYYANKILPQASPDTFDVLDGYYVKDAGHLYFFGQLLEEVDLASLQIINRNFVADKNFVYQDGKKIWGSDPATFVVLSGGEGETTVKGEALIAEDANYLYYRFGEPRKKQST